MMKNIVLFGAGKSATCLIDYLALTCKKNHWSLTVADNDLESLKKKLVKLPTVHPVKVNVENTEERSSLVGEANLVISLLPANLHILIARECVAASKNLLTASYVNEEIRSLQPEIRTKGLLFLCEMGLDPGIDHMSAMLLIDRIRAEGGNIFSFRSHTGGLVAPESDDNPWHYKISWNPRNVVRAGSSGAIYKEDAEIRQTSYEDLFENTGRVSVEEAGDFAFYPNRDSLSYIPVYGLQDAVTFMRTTLRHPDFCMGWKHIVAAGLTDDQLPVPSSIKTFAAWSKPLQQYINAFNKPLYDQLGIFDESPLPGDAHTSADLLQFLIEKKWKMQEQDKDLIVMLHELGYATGQKRRSLKSSLVVKGENNIHTAMAKTVGLPLGIAARLILEEKITLSGLHIPILPEIYQPVLEELAKEGIRFQETVS